MQAMQPCGRNSEICGERSVRSLIPNKNSDWMKRLMQDYAEAVGEAAQKEAEDVEDVEVPPELDRLCRTIIRHAPLEKQKKKRLLRPATVAAAILAVLLVGMIAVQAAGVNLFGVHANWNDDILNVTPEAKDGKALSDRAVSQGSILDTVLEEQGFPLSLGPSEIPAGYTLSELRTSDTEGLKTVYVRYTGKNDISISISQLREQNSYIVEKNTETPEMYTTKSGRTFLLLCNTGRWAGSWSDGGYAVTFWGFETRKQLIQTIDSMED